MKKEKTGGTTVKGFFKSNAFKCIAVLLGIVLVCGILLTICNSLFYVSDAEQLQRALNKIYGKSVTATEVDLDAPNISSFEIETNGSTSESYIESMADEVKDGSLYKYKTEEQIASILNTDGEFSAGNVDEELQTGATYSTLLASYAALFAAANYELCLDNVSLTDEDAELEYTTYIDLSSTTYTVNDGAVEYVVVTTGYSRANAFTVNITISADGIVAAYEIVENGSTNDYDSRMPEAVLDGSLYIGKNEAQLLELFDGDDFTVDGVDSGSTIATGATYSNFLCTYAALFAVANYDIFADGELSENETPLYTTYIEDYTFSVEGTGDNAVVTYSITTTGLGRVNSFTLNISVRGCFETTYTAGTINSVYYIEDDGNYLINATGTGGFSGGSVTCWVVVTMNYGIVSGVEKVVIDSNSGQSYINKVNKDSILDEFTGTFDSGEEVSSWQGTGATYSLNAIANSVNTALQFVREQLTDEQTDLLNSALSQIYVNENVTAEEIDLSPLNTEYTNGEILSAYSISNGDILVLSKGTGGFSDGSVTCWVQLKMTDGKLSGIGTVLIQSNADQSYISNITDDVLGQFSSEFDGYDFTTSDFASTGATASLNAVINSVNTAMAFVNGNSITGGAQ